MCVTKAAQVMDGQQPCRPKFTVPSMLGRPTIDGKIARGASSPAKPHLTMPLPLSHTIAATTASAMTREATSKCKTNTLSQNGYGYVFVFLVGFCQISGRTWPRTPFKRIGPDCGTERTRNQPRRPILRPFRGTQKLPPDCLQVPRMRNGREGKAQH